MFIQKKHLGVILEPSETGFDAGAASFGCIFSEEDDPSKLYLYYSGAKDPEWKHVAIGLAVSHDGKEFKKFTQAEPLVDGEKGQFNSKESLTPAVVRIGNYYYMFFAGSSESANPLHYRRKIGVAYSNDPGGPWKVYGIIAEPLEYWEGRGIDLGTSIIKLSEREILIFYSNVNIKIPFNVLFGYKFYRRCVGILKVKINSPSSIEALKYDGNPLRNLNGPKGSPNESLFCPGYFLFNNKHFLLPSMSTYSNGFPPHQYIGLTFDDNPYFKNVTNISTLIDGSKEKKDILPHSKGEIALDTPFPIIMENKIYLYYSVMDRYDGIWKTALTVIDNK